MATSPPLRLHWLPKHGWRLTSVLLAAMGALGLLVYWPALSGGFIFDDLPNLVRSETWKVDSLNPSALWNAMASDISGAIGRPLAMLSFAINHAISGPGPFALKFTNLLMHLANGGLVFVLCRQLLRLDQPARATGLWPNLAAFLLASAWLLHQLQVSTVMYAVQRMEIGAAIGVLICVIGYVAARQRQLAGRAGASMFAVSAAGLLLGLGFKESALVAPALLLLVEAIVFRFRGPDGGRYRVVAVAHASWVLLAALAYFLVVLPDALQSNAYELRGYTAGQRLLSQGPVLLMYLGQILYPLPEGMPFYYDHLQVPATWTEPPVLLAMAALLVLAGLAAVMRRRSPLCTLGILWFFACHGLTSNVIPLELAFEHRNYLALLGPLLALYPLFAWLLGRLHGDAAFAAGMVPVAALAALCLLQTSTWGDPFRLAGALAGRNPESSRAAYAFGSQLHSMAAGDTDSPLWALAEAEFKESARLPGASALPDQALVVLASSGGRTLPLEHWQAFEEKLLGRPPRPDDISALYNVVDCQLSGRCTIPASSVASLLDRMEARNPYSTPISIMRANHAWNGLQDQDLAISVLRNRRERRPGAYQVDLALAEMLMASNLLGNKGEIEALLSGLQARPMPPEERRKVEALAARLGRDSWEEASH